MTEKVKRRLSTILCADVAGYSRLMEADETGTLTALRRNRNAIARLVNRHDGRIVNTWGDAVIAEFSSVVEAVQCAVEVQSEISGNRETVLENQKMQFRIGVNLGDVLVEGDDVYGDGVNVAARLQELAEPGGILISGPVYDQVYNKLTIGFESLGNQNVKNISHPVFSYRVVRGDAAAKPEAARADPQSNADARPLPSEFGEGSMASFWQWYRGLPRSIAAVGAISAFLILINVFTGLDPVWFHWPVSVMVLGIVMTMIFRRRSG